MSKVKITETYLTNIANAIRAKNQTETQYKPSEMADAINDIEYIIPNGKIESYLAESETIPANTFVVISNGCVKKMQIPTHIFHMYAQGLTRSECTTFTPGEVWVLNSD